MSLISDLAAYLDACIANDSSVAFFAGQDEQMLGPLADHAIADADHRSPHAYRWTPARVAAHCQARQALVNEARRHPDDPTWEFVLRHLAAPYADMQPGYRDEWRPPAP